ncbi:calcium-binding protein [Synechococcus elongatus]|uniref:calcium-binding protein n=1 Tax=Synechococcus elongatus TaxID=32046 RepID=UPI000F7E63B8|nr:calcium-binding protein [Synechococcus elongatus]
MKVLVTIPHFYNPRGTTESANPNGGYGSVGNNAQPRIDALSSVLNSLSTQFTSAAVSYRYTDKMTYQVISPSHIQQLDIVICTTQSFHILNQIVHAHTNYIHHSTECMPKLLGFECHKILQSHLDQYDFYCYLEDDIIIHDSLFFQKIQWFNKHLDYQSVLQPNRYEISTNSQGKPCKHYIDFTYNQNTQKELLNSFCGIVMGNKIRFERAQNPHSGCFFLTNEQLRYWCDQEHFLDMDIRYFGPLESAATLGLIKTFQVFKVAYTDSHFFEVQHFGNTWAQKIMRVQMRSHLSQSQSTAD